MRMRTLRNYISRHKARNMASKVFLDANILLDFTLQRAAYKDASEILEMAVSGQIQAFVTPSIIQISGYWIAKAYGNAKAKELLSTLLKDVKIIDISQEMVLSALNSKISDIEDALQYFTALYHKLDFFISLDKQLKQHSLPVLPVLSPSSILKAFKS
jgi:predicted nucleic acid-binding protein